MIDIRTVATRQFGACLAVMMATGAILLATTQFLPQLVQQDFAYTATWAGLVLTPGGLVTVVMMVIVGPLSGKAQPKYLIAVGASFCAISMWSMTGLNADSGFWFFSHSRMLLGVGLPLIFIPIMTASYDGVPANKTDQASAIINAARNTGGSIGVSLGTNIIAHREQFHQSRLAEAAIPSSAAYNDALQRATHFFTAHSGSLACLRRRVLNADADLRRGHSPRVDPAQRETRRIAADGALMTAVGTQV